VGPMSTRLVHLVVDAADPAGLARFWSGALAWPVTFDEPDEVVIEPPKDDPAQAGQLPLVFVPVPEPKTSKNLVHLDVASTCAWCRAARQPSSRSAALSSPIQPPKGNATVRDASEALGGGVAAVAESFDSAISAHSPWPFVVQGMTS
jgi:hypothetical protein